VLLFGNNPVYRGETIGTYALVFNAILNYQHLAHESALAEKISADQTQQQTTEPQAGR